MYPSRRRIREQGMYEELYKLHTKRLGYLAELKQTWKEAETLEDPIDLVKAYMLEWAAMCTLMDCFEEAKRITSKYEGGLN